METSNLDPKYQKLATEYSKIRAQANVLKKAVLEEQNKSFTLREALRQKETELRRSEQEVDSLTFRNKQLEHRVAFLQDDIDRDAKKTIGKLHKGLNKLSPHKNNLTHDAHSEILISEELQKKIIENAQLTSMNDDKDQEIRLQNARINDLEEQLTKLLASHTESERRLRKEFDVLVTRNSELETKLVEAASMLGSEDALSVSGSENTPLLTHSSTGEDRIGYLEKELFHWKTQYEILKINDSAVTKSNRTSDMKLQNGPTDKKLDTTDGNIVNLSKEQLLYNHFSKKYEDLLKAKYTAESSLTSYLTECENLQFSLENLTKELNDREQVIKDFAKSLEMSEEDLAITRKNYDEQISVLTEQVISLSEQLASASK